MATKKKAPSIPAQLKELRAEHAALQQQAKKLETDLSQKESMRGHYQRTAEKAEAEVEQVHAFLDSVPGAIERKVTGEYGVTTERAAMTRLAAWLAVRS